MLICYDCPYYLISTDNNIELASFLIALKIFTEIIISIFATTSRAQGLPWLHIQILFCRFERLCAISGIQPRLVLYQANPNGCTTFPISCIKLFNKNTNKENISCVAFKELHLDTEYEQSHRNKILFHSNESIDNVIWDILSLNLIVF